MSTTKKMYLTGTCLAIVLIIASCDSSRKNVTENYADSATSVTDEVVPESNTESYNLIVENEFKNALENPFSTFSIDVDGASYSNARRFISQNQLPPKDAVRVEEFINYFEYDYPQPTDNKPFNVITNSATCPWNSAHQLIQIALQGKKIPFDELPPCNLVFLVDVSGSMDDNTKLPLVKRSLKALTKQLRNTDYIALVVYAGAAGQVLPSTSGDEKETIEDAIDNLKAGGSTAGGAGLELAYKIAEENFESKSSNRIILCTDGDFNIGASSDAEMTRLIESKRDAGIYITVLGFGMGNYKDSKMEAIADHGNGNYFYIDNFDEAKKVLVTQLDGTLYTIAKDVKIQVEFNPALVKSYRLIGYENRALNKEDFTNDKKDAGEIGAGHTVTAFYEVDLKNGNEDNLTADAVSSKYSETKVKAEAMTSDELMTVHLRYKLPDENKSEAMNTVIKNEKNPFENAPTDFRFGAAVAQYAMLLRDSQFKGTASLKHIIETAKNATGKDTNGYRKDFIEMVEETEDLLRK
ncbi:MAG: VWA domain-containing protein [Bacteroidia bacterium]